MMTPSIVNFVVESSEFKLSCCTFHGLSVSYTFKNEYLYTMYSYLKKLLPILVFLMSFQSVAQIRHGGSP
jgi:hypothetical protein